MSSRPRSTFTDDLRSLTPFGDLVEAELGARRLGRLAELAHGLPQAAARLRQPLGAEDQQREDEHDDDLHGADVHEGIPCAGGS